MNLADDETEKKTELLLPSFKVEVKESDTFRRSSVSSDFTSRNKFYGLVQLVSGRTPSASISKPIGEQSEIIENDFLFGK